MPPHVVFRGHILMSTGSAVDGQLDRSRVCLASAWMSVAFDVLNHPPPPTPTNSTKSTLHVKRNCTRAVSSCLIASHKSGLAQSRTSSRSAVVRISGRAHNTWGEALAFAAPRRATPSLITDVCEFCMSDNISVRSAEWHRRHIRTRRNERCGRVW